MTKVDAGYNWQWGRQVQVDKRMLALLTRHGYEAQHTGGGCMAWEKPLPCGGYLMITDGELGLGDWDERNLVQWYACRFHEDGDLWSEPEGGAFLTLADALAIAETLPEPTD